MTEKEIISLILKGDRNKFRILVEKYQQMIFRTCMGFLHNKEDAEDLTQEIFIKAFQSLQGFKGASSFSTWIYRIAVNASLNRVRKSSGKMILDRLDTLFGTGKEKEISYKNYDEENPESILVMQEYNEWVRKALDNLPEKQRTAIVLSKYDDLPQKEIAEIMNTTEGAIEALIQRAKKNLKLRLTSSHKKK
jgi:RNA polymerase sigma-70 factor (ECF subfamily)